MQQIHATQLNLCTKAMVIDDGALGKTKKNLSHKCVLWKEDLPSVWELGYIS